MNTTKVIVSRVPGDVERTKRKKIKLTMNDVRCYMTTAQFFLLLSLPRPHAFLMSTNQQCV